MRNVRAMTDPKKVRTAAKVKAEIGRCEVYEIHGILREWADEILRATETRVMNQSGWGELLKVLRREIGVEHE